MMLHLGLTPILAPQEVGSTFKHQQPPYHRWLDGPVNSLRPATKQAKETKDLVGLVKLAT